VTLIGKIFMRYGFAELYPFEEIQLFKDRLLESPELSTNGNARILESSQNKERCDNPPR
jgi:hypothetical protein